MAVEAERHDVFEFVVGFIIVVGGYSEIVVVVRIVTGFAVLDLEGAAVTIDCTVSHQRHVHALLC